MNSYSSNWNTSYKSLLLHAFWFFTPFWVKTTSLGKTKMASGEIDPQPHKYWPSVESLKAFGQKKLQATLLFVDFTKAFDSIHRGKMEQILLAYGLPKDTVAAIMILYRNTKVKVRSPDGDTEYFDIVAGVLQGDTLAPYLFIICLDYVLRTSIDKIRENGFELTKKRSKRYPAKTITDAWMHYMDAN